VQLANWRSALWAMLGYPLGKNFLGQQWWRRAAPLLRLWSKERRGQHYERI